MLKRYVRGDNFVIRHSMFDIRYSPFYVQGPNQMQILAKQLLLWNIPRDILCLRRDEFEFHESRVMEEFIDSIDDNEAANKAAAVNEIFRRHLPGSPCLIVMPVPAYAVNQQISTIGELHS
jgi:hypothetical protein